jgi:hypothetical protein
MSKSLFKSLISTLVVDFLGWVTLILPFAAVYAVGPYHDVATWYTYIAYAAMTLYGLLYMGGSIRCEGAVARSVLIDLKHNDRWYSYIPVMVVIAASINAYIHAHYLIGTVIILPMIIVFISRRILTFKANKV